MPTDSKREGRPPCRPHYPLTDRAAVRTKLAPHCNAQEFSNAQAHQSPAGQHFKALASFKRRGFFNACRLKTGGTTSVSSALPLN